MEELSTKPLAEFDSKIRFNTPDLKGNKERDLELLAKLDGHLVKHNKGIEPINIYRVVFKVN